jgi:hypothetical protein
MSELKILVTILCCFGTGCDRGAPDTTSHKPAPAAVPASAVSIAEPTTDVPASVAKALGEYETIRELLAKDEHIGTGGPAAHLGAAARQAANTASPAQRPHLEAIAKAAHAVETAATSDIEAARRAFGELSRAVVALLATDAGLRKGRYIFECPMAEGYKKWVQLSKAIENPYMGKKMLSCGGESDWKV